MSNSVKINFNLQPDADGYPPVTVESLWVNIVGDNYEINNIPFFTSEAAVGDLVHAVRDQAGALWFDGIAHRSQHSLIRVVFFDPDCEQAVAAQLQSLGCGIEGFKKYRLLAVDIPGDVDIDQVRKFLSTEAAAGRLDFEEAILRQ